MILEKSKTASVPARSEFGRNEPTIQLLVWRFKQRNGKRYRVASCLGEFSVWEEGVAERQVFRINLGVLSEVTRRAKAARLRAVLELSEGIYELPKWQDREIWRQCTTDPELRFCATTRQCPAMLGGWRQCLEKAAELLAGTGRRVPWCEEEALLAPEE
mgnify:CR=1 FL=1